jgi:hypothetical protein
MTCTDPTRQTGGRPTLERPSFYAVENNGVRALVAWWAYNRYQDQPAINQARAMRGTFAFANQTGRTWDDRLAGTLAEMDIWASHVDVEEMPSSAAYVPFSNGGQTNDAGWRRSPTEMAAAFGLFRPAGPRITHVNLYEPRLWRAAEATWKNGPVGGILSYTYDDGSEAQFQLFPPAHPSSVFQLFLLKGRNPIPPRG